MYKSKSVVQVWYVIMSESEAILHLICQYADQLGTNILESFLQVVAEKKLLRKLYAEKRTAMEIELDRVII